MNESGRLWLLMSHLQTLALGAIGRTTKSVGTVVECVVPDPQHCIEYD